MPSSPDLWLPSKYGKYDDVSSEENTSVGSKVAYDDRVVAMEERWINLLATINDRIEAQKTMYVNELRGRLAFAVRNYGGEELMSRFEKEAGTLHLIPFKDL